jgi:hypothetical protein
MVTTIIRKLPAPAEFCLVVFICFWWAILPIGLLFGFVYWKWRRLWPLFIAHALFDVFAFIPR